MNIDAAKRGAEEARDFADDIVETLRDSLLTLKPDLRMKRANAIFYKMFQVIRNDTGGRFLCDLDNGQRDVPRLRQLSKEIPPCKSAFNDLEVEHEFSRVGNRWMLLNTRRISGKRNKPQAVLLILEDITQSGASAG